MDVDSTKLRKVNYERLGLQWSHVLMDVDSLNIHHTRRYHEASMEPRPDGRG